MSDGLKKSAIDTIDVPAKTKKPNPLDPCAVEEIPAADLEGVAGGMGCTGTCDGTHIST